MFGFATEVEGREILGARDLFVQCLGGFERGVRMGQDREVEEGVFLTFATSCVRDWPRDLAHHVGASLDGLTGKLLPWARMLPKEIQLVHTTGQEEAGSGYTRGAAIVLPPGKAWYSAERLVRFVVHECFHLLTRFNPETRDRLYALLGFHPCGNVVLPGFVDRWRITNPDAPRSEHAVTTHVGNRTLLLLPVLHWAEPRFLPGPYFEHVQMSLFELQPERGGWGVAPGSNPHPKGLLENLFTMKGLSFDQPEEMLAELFVQRVLDDKTTLHPVVAEMERILAG
jgi:hypothetical protein